MTLAVPNSTALVRPMKYVSLHGHSTYSTGDGHGLPKEHVDRVVELGMGAIGLSEHGNVSSWADLEQECEKAGIEPIFGIEIYYGIPEERRKTHMVLIAMNSIGLQNINRIVTQSWKQFYQWPTVYWKDLVQWNEGIIALSGCADSALSCILLGGKFFGEKRLQPNNGSYELALRGVQKFKKIFGDRYYLEVQRFPGLERTCTLNPILAQLSRDAGVPLVATSDVHYPHPEQNAIQRILHAAHRGGTVESADASWEYDILLTYPTKDIEIIKDLMGTGLSKEEAKESVLNTQRIAERCKGTRLPKANPPKFGVDDPQKALQESISVGWKDRLQYNEYMQKHIPEYKIRLKHEFETICAREGFADYFLIVADLIVWAKSQGIAVGPGRGSSAGSLVCYLLKITEIDSMQFPMLFERFLDPTRTDPPDIDIDFEDERRDEVFSYAARKYGVDCVANIGTFTRYLGKNSLDDIARVYHIPLWKIDQIKSKLLQRSEGHPRFAFSLQDTYDTFPEIRELVQKTPELRYAPRLEGNLRSFGVHAAGMVVSSVPLNEICATYQRAIGTSGRVGQAIPYDKREASYVGLLKIDALSLITMGEIAGICKMANISLEELYRIPLDDDETLQAFRDGDVMGIFQFEGVTTRRILKKVAPQHIMHLSDVNALARPGADDKGYIKNKNSGELPEFAHPIIEKYTTEWPNTYGVITYEEQILYILRDLGGFEPKELNRMRKIIHDKLGSNVFNEYLDRFIKGAAVHGVSKETARSIWDGMVSASGYAFNIAHSVSYAHIGYWLQWLKIHYSAQFYAKKLSKCGDAVRRGKFITEAERHGIEVRPPELLQSQQDWALKGKTIYAGFSAVDGIGPKTAENIIKWRDSRIGARPMPNILDVEEIPLHKTMSKSVSIQQVEEYIEAENESELEWSDLLEVKGIGKKTIEKILSFVESDDPFGVQKMARILNKVRKNSPIKPTHTSVDMPEDGELCCYTGVVMEKKYYNAVEQLQKRESNLEYDEALNQLRDNHLLEYAALYVEDEYGETVRISVDRWRYPGYSKEIDGIKKKHDVVVVQGLSSDFGGIGINRIKNLIVVKG